MINLIFRLFRRRWLGGGVVVVALYGLTLWLAPQCVNKPALRAYLRGWFEQSLDETSPTAIGRIDVALREHGRADLYVEDVAFDAPNFAFALPWLEIGTLRASAPVYELWGKIRPAAQIQIRSPRARLQWQDGECNLDGLRLAPHLQFPFTAFDPGDFAVEIRDGKILVEHPLLAGAFDLQGKGEYNTIGADHGRISHLQLTGAVDFPDAPEYRRAERNPIFSLQIADAYFETNPLSLAAQAIITLDNLPLRALNLLAPALPVFPDAATFSGTLNFAETAWRLRGTLRNPPWFSENLALDLRAENSPSDTTFTLYLSTAAQQAEIAAAHWRLRRGGKNELLTVAVPRLNIAELSTLFTANLANWNQWLFAKFPSTRLQIAQLAWRNFHFNALNFEFTTDNEALNIAAESTIAGGKILLLANGVPFGANFGLPPKSFRLTLDIPALGDTLLFFSDWLPPLYQIRPLRGKGQASVRYESNSDDNALKIQLALTDVIIPEIPAGEMLQALLSMRAGMREIENMTRRAALTAPPLLPSMLSADNQQLTLNSAVANYQVDKSGKNSLTLLEAESPQLGKIRGFGEMNPDQSFRLSLWIKDAPKILFADLSPSTRAVAEEVMESEGLQIDGLATPSGGIIERRYIQDVFKRWLEEQGKNTVEGTAGKKDE